MTTHYSVDRDVAVIQLDNPPVNGLGLATRESLVANLHRGLDDPQVSAIVITGGGGVFCAGADITEFGTDKPWAEPSLLDIDNEFEQATKPVIAAIDGTCLGGGLEISLAMHYRIATGSSKVGLPEVQLGIVPGAGGTQRLPRVIDVKIAAEMISSGAPRTAGELAAIEGQRLFDRVVDGDVVEEAKAFAREVANVRPMPRVRDLPAMAASTTDFSALRQRLEARGRGVVAPLRGLDLVETATKTDFDEGIDAERRTFEELVNSEQSQALRHVFFAERTARNVPDIPNDIELRTVESVAVVGAGTMGTGIAMNFLNAGMPVRILEAKQEALDRGVNTIQKTYQAQADKGRLEAEAVERRMNLLTPTIEYADIADCDLVIEAVFEEMDIKKAVFRQLDEVMKPGAILATNTSTLDVDAIAATTSRPADVLGMHFFSPAHVMPLLEVVRGAQTADDVLATVLKVGQRIRKTTVVAGVCDGFIGNRMLEQYTNAARILVENGATPYEVDSALEDFGMAMGPFRMSDLAGNDITWAIRKRHYAQDPDAPRDEIADQLCEMGRFGQKTGAGWYDYDAGDRRGTPSPVVEELLSSYHQTRGRSSKTFAPEEIVHRLIFALVDEGARILDEGIALRASDIDVVYTAGYGFPRHRGGPMFYADTVGLATVVEELQRFAPEGWEPAGLLTRLAAEGNTFSDCNAHAM